MLSQAVYDSSGNITHYKYVNGETVRIMAEMMNFTPIYIQSDDGALLGSQIEDGSFTGNILFIKKSNFIYKKYF